MVGLWLKEEEDLMFGSDFIGSPKKMYQMFSDFAFKSGKQSFAKPRFYKRMNTLGYKRKKIN
jgi:hypothetical protein